SNVWTPAVPLAGGTMTGPLTLSADPTAAMHAATRQYVLAQSGAYLPLAGGTLTGWLTVGTNTLASNSEVRINAAAGQYRSLSFMTGGVARWVLSASAEAESGANAGSN